MKQECWMLLLPRPTSRSYYVMTLFHNHVVGAIVLKNVSFTVSVIM
jgi:hypothetical protein